jgi:hypothetical protein
MLTRFRNRTLAGERLAERLTAYSGRPDVLVLALLLGRHLPDLVQLTEMNHIRLT